MTVARGRLLLRDRRRLRGRGGAVLRLDARRRSRQVLGAEDARRLLRLLRHQPSAATGKGKSIPNTPAHAVRGGRARSGIGRRRAGGARRRASRAAALRGARRARAARARRQGPHGLERPDDLGPGRGRTACWATRATSTPPTRGRGLRARQAARAPTAGCCAPVARARPHLDALPRGLRLLGRRARRPATRRAAPERFLREAAALAERMRDDFADRGRAASTRPRATTKPLIVRHREGHDGATPARTPSPRALLARLSYHFDRADLREDARRRAPRLRPRDRAPAARVRHEPGRGRPAARGPGRARVRRRAGRPTARRCGARWRAHYLPNRVVAHHDPARRSDRHAVRCWRARGWWAAAPRSTSAATSPARRPVTEPGRSRPRSHGTRAKRRRQARRAGSPRRSPGRATGEGTAGLRAPPRARPAGYGPLGSTGLVVQPPGLRRLPRRRRHPGAPRGAREGAARGLQPDRHLDQLHRRRQRAPDRRGAGGAGARRAARAARRSSWSPRSATSRAKNLELARGARGRGAARSRRW